MYDSQYHREWYQKNKDKRKKQLYASKARRVARNRAYVIDYLKENPCVDCGVENIIVLEFDHVRGEKIETISWMVSNGFALNGLIAEINKCEVACANCHRIRTNKSRKFYRVLL